MTIHCLITKICELGARFFCAAVNYEDVLSVRDLLSVSLAQRDGTPLDIKLAAIWSSNGVKCPEFAWEDVRVWI